MRRWRVPLENNQVINWERFDLKTIPIDGTKPWNLTKFNLISKSMCVSWEREQIPLLQSEIHRVIAIYVALQIVALQAVVTKVLLLSRSIISSSGYGGAPHPLCLHGVMGSGRAAAASRRRHTRLCSSICSSIWSRPKYLLEYLLKYFIEYLIEYLIEYIDPGLCSKSQSPMIIDSLIKVILISVVLLKRRLLWMRSIGDLKLFNFGFLPGLPGQLAPSLISPPWPSRFKLV